MVWRWVPGLSLALCVCIVTVCVASAAVASTPKGETTTLSGIEGIEGSLEVDGRLAHILRRGRLIVGVKTDYPPWGMRDREGDIVGMEPDLARDLGRRLGIPVELRSVTAANRLGMLARGNVDVLIATMADTGRRRSAVDLIRPHYYSSGVRLLTESGGYNIYWSDLAGLPVCLTDGAFFNRDLVARYDLDARIFSGTRDTRLALRDGRCVGWAYDNSALSQMLAGEGMDDYEMTFAPIFETPWSVAVAEGEGERSLGRFLAQTVAGWHRSGFLLDRQAAWDIPLTRFLWEQEQQFTRRDESGALECRPGSDGMFPESCLEPAPQPPPPEPAPAWAQAIRAGIGLDLTALFNALNRERLLAGVATTIAMSVVAIIGSMVVGILLAIANQDRPGRLWRWLVFLPSCLLTNAARMTPPILQLYIVFFGLGGFLATRYGLTVNGFVVAAIVFSVYAGASNAAVLGPTLERRIASAPGASLPRQVGHAVEQCFEALVSIMVNIVKAAGMATVIAVPEVISVVTRLIGEGGHAVSLMTLLLVFYFGFVLLVMLLLERLKRVIQP